MSLKAQDGSSTSMATRSERMTIFDVGSQRHCHWPILCVRWPKLAGSWWELRLMTAVPLNGCGSNLCLNYLFCLYPTILILFFSLPTGFWHDEKRAHTTRRLKRVWIVYFYVCVSVCVWMHAGVCLWKLRLPFITELGSQGTAGDLGCLGGHWLALRGTMSLR